MGYTNSPLVHYVKLSPNHSGLRKHKIDTISIHCVVGHLSLQTLGNVFYSAARGASSNYGIDDAGRIAMFVEEKNRSWCTSSNSNDQRAITIEVASDTFTPYKITDGAMQGLIQLCADICKRNGIPKLLWRGDKSLIGRVDLQNLTVHRWFAAKACPGDFIYDRLGFIAQEVNKILNNVTSKPTPIPTVVVPKPPTSPFVPYIVRINTTVLNYRKGPGTNFAVVGSVKKNQAFTIVAEAVGPGASKWGKLKSGAGWVSLDYCKK